jgi:hypothetical protein
VHEIEHDGYRLIVRRDGETVRLLTRRGHDGPVARRSPPTTYIRHVLAERRRQIDLVVLLVYENLPNLLRHGKFAEGFTLPNPLAVIPDRFILIFQIKAEHVLCRFRSPNRLGRDGRHFAQIVDLPRNDQGVLQLLMGV